MSTVTSQIASSGEFLQRTKLAPIALFVYNRPEHTRLTVEALRKNEFAQMSDLFVFADAPKNEADAARVEQVRRVLRGIEGFRSVTLVERDQNLGLSKSIISGVTQLCAEYGRMISVEDDIVTAPDFLSFINRGLEQYKDEPKIFSINGFNFPIVPPASYPWDAYFSYRSNSWGWGTWRDRWEKVDWSVSDFSEFIANRERQKRFNRGGSDLAEALAHSVASKRDGSWDVVWAYTHSRHDALALRPVVSKVYNVGFDGSGMHGRRAPFKQVALLPNISPDYRLPDSVVEPDLYFAAEIQRLNRPSRARKAARYLLNKLGRR